MFGMNPIVYVDRSIKLIEKVPELLAITIFLKSFLTSSWYKMTLRINKIIIIAPIAPNKYLTLVFISCNKLPNDNKARARPEIGMGNFLMRFIFI